MPGRTLILLVAAMFCVPLKPAEAQKLPCSPTGNITTCPLNALSTPIIGPNALIQGADGLFYGTTDLGGKTPGLACTDTSGNPAACCGTDNSGNALGCGTVFSFDPGTSMVTVLYNFTGGGDGGSPTGLVQGGDGYLYGTTLTGGASVNQQTACTDPLSGAPSPCCLDSSATINVGCGTAFRISTTGQSFQTLNNFYTAGNSGTFANSGAFPGPLVPGGGPAQGSTATTFYGTTLACSMCNSSTGTLFSLAIPAGGTAQIGLLYDFAKGPSNGTSAASSLIYPNALIEGGDGNLYGSAQLGGYTSNSATPCMEPSTYPAYGCGGVFVYSPSGGTEAETLFSGPPSVVGNHVPAAGASQTHLPFRPEAIVRQPQHSFPTGGPWSFSEDLVTLAEASNGDIYGTTPPVCANSSNAYIVSASCGTDYATDPTTTPIYNPGTLFGIVTEGSGAALTSPTVLSIYPFTQSADGGGSLSGVFLGSDGLLYGSSGNLVFDLPASGSSSTTLPDFATLGAPYAALVQGSNGNFYGVTAGSNTSSDPGELFMMPGPASGSSPAQGPVQLSFSPDSVHAGSPTTLSWTVSNAFSVSAQQCYAFAQSGAPDASSWTGLQQGATTSQGWGGSLSFTPTAVGTYTYAMTCGGNESATAALTVNAAVIAIQTPSFPTGVVGRPWSVTLHATGGVGTYTWSLAPGSSLPGSLQLSSAGLISGTPMSSGTFTFTVQVADSESTPATQTATFSFVVNPSLVLTGGPLKAATAGQMYSTTLTASGGLGSYTWSAASGSLPDWLNLNPSTGVLSGTPASGGTVSFTISVTDAENPPANATADFSIQVAAPASPSVTANPATIVIASPGGTGSTTLTFTNFTGSTISPSCTAGLPQESSCSFTNLTTSSATLTITTTAPSVSVVAWPGEIRFAGGWFLPALALLVAGGRRRRGLMHIGMVLLIVVAGFTTGCGGGSTTPTHRDSGTPIGTYPVTVTATSGTQTAPATVTLTVQ